MKVYRPYTVAFLCVALLACSATHRSVRPGISRSLINGKDLSGWVAVTGAASNWRVEDNRLILTGKQTSVLRTDKQYENFILELEAHMDEKEATAALLLHADALPAPGKPLQRSIRLDLTGADDHSFKPVNGAGLTVSTAGSEPETVAGWNRYRIESKDGSVTVYINGKPALSGTRSNPRKGYLGFMASGTGMTIRNIQIRELPSTNPQPDETAVADQGFQPLFTGSGFSAWDMKAGHKGHWTALDWMIDYDGKSSEKDRCLWSKKSYGDFVLVADVRLTRKPEPARSPVVLPNGDNATNEDGSAKEVEVPYAGDTGIYLRGHSKNQVNIGYRYIGSGEIYGYRMDKKMPAEVRAGVTPAVKADKPPGEWNRFIITMKGNRVSVVLNDTLVIDNALLPGIAATGPIALQDDHASNNTFQFANLFIREL